MQAASLYAGERITDEVGPSGRSFDSSCVPSDPCEAWETVRLGLMTHLNPTSVLLGVLTEAPEALLAFSSDLVSLLFLMPLHSEQP